MHPGRNGRFIWRVKCVRLTDTRARSCGGESRKRTRSDLPPHRGRSTRGPLSFLSENVKGEKASMRTKIRRKEKSE